MKCLFVKVRGSSAWAKGLGGLHFATEIYMLERSGENHTVLVGWGPSGEAEIGQGEQLRE